MKDKFKDTKGLDKAYMSLAKHYDERKENAIRQVKDGAFVDLLNQEQAELQKAMIEEMAKIISNARDTYFGTDAGKDGYYTPVGHYAKELYEQGYRKLPKDSIVLSREEYNETLEQFRQEIVTLSQELVNSHKETAKKYYNFVNNAIENANSGHSMGVFRTTTIEGICNTMHLNNRKIAKQFGVEIKE